jgi:RNA polymerase sigma-70 factor, ECF subfamily
VLGEASTHGRISLVLQALERHRRELEAFVRARVPAADVEDVLQVVRLRATEGAALLDRPESVRAWLYRITRNAVVDARRSDASRARHVTFVADPPEAEEPVAEETCQCILALARDLRPSHAAVLTMVDVEGTSLAEASVRLGISRNNATVRLHRARKALRERLRDHCGVTTARDCLDCPCEQLGCCS